MNNIINNMREDFVPDIFKEAAEAHNITVAELIQAGSNEYDKFIERGMEVCVNHAACDGMSKQASIDDLEYMDKQAVFLSSAAIFAALSVPFSAINAYDLGKNVIGGTGDILKGRLGSAAKRLPAMAFDSLGIMPGIGVLGKMNKWRRAMKGAKTFKGGAKALYKAEQSIAYAKKLPGYAKAAKNLGAGKWSISAPTSIFRSKAGRQAMAGKYDKLHKGYGAYLNDTKKSMVSAFGKGADKMKTVEGDLARRFMAFPTTKKVAGHTKEMIPVFNKLHSPGWHKFYQYADPLDVLSSARMLPLAPLAVGGMIGSNSLQNAGAKGLDYMNYYGPDASQNVVSRTMMNRARGAANAGGYMAGYNYNG